MKLVISDAKEQRELFDKCAAHVGVVIDSTDNMPIGTGVFVKIDTKCFFVTAKHVVNQDIFQKILKVSFNFIESGGEGGLLLTFDSIYSELNRDIAFFTVDPAIDINYFDNSSNTYEETKNVLLWGCPSDITQRDDPQIRFRLLNLWTEVKEYSDYLRMNIDYQFDINKDQLKNLGGISGGPIFNSKGDLVGITKRQIFSSVDKIEDVEATIFKNCNVADYIHSSVRHISLYEFPLLFHTIFKVEVNGEMIELCYESLMGLNYTDDDNYLDCWLTFHRIGKRVDGHYEVKVQSIDHSMPLFMERNIDLILNGREFKNITSSGKKKFENSAHESIFQMLFGETNDRQRLEITSFEWGFLSEDRFEQYRNSFSLHPIRLPKELREYRS